MFPETKTDSSLRIVLDSAECRLVRRFVPQQINYGVMYVLFSGEKTTTVKFRASVRCTHRFPDESSIFEIDRASQTYINDTEPDLIADELALKTSAVLYPLQVRVNSDNQLIAVENYNDIRARWEHRQQELLKAYKGEWVEKYLRLTGLSLKEEDALLRALSSDWFLAAYFNDLYGPYTKVLSIERIAGFPLAGKAKPVEFRVRQTLEPFYDESNLVRVNIEGTFGDERCKADLESELDYPHFALSNPQAEKAQGSYRAKYFLDPKFHGIEYALLECDIGTAPEKKIMITINNLEENKQYAVSSAPLPFTVEEGREKKKDSFWDLFR